MTRFNFLTLIHKSLKAALYDGALTLQQASVHTADEAAFLADKICEVTMLLDEWTRKEEHFILPEIGLYEPSIVDTMQREHEENRQLSNKLTTGLNLLEQCKTKEQRAEILNRLNHDYMILLAVQLRHLAKEERIINSMLYRYCNDAFIKDTLDQLRRRIAPWHMAFFHKWMLRGMNKTETAALLKMMQETASPVEFETLYAYASLELSPSALQQIKRILLQETPAA